MPAHGATSATATLALPEPIAGVSLVAVPMSDIKPVTAGRRCPREGRGRLPYDALRVSEAAVALAWIVRGLTGIAWRAAGLNLPRDARQQILVGKMVATPYYRPPSQAGDLVFFTDEAGHVVHVGISVGGNRFLHSSPPEVQLSSFDPADPLYTETWTKAFAFARRPM